MALSEVIDGPGAEPVSAADACRQLKLDDVSSYTPLIEPLLVAAREEVEHELGRSLITQTRRLRRAAWPCGGRFGDGIELDHPPVQRVVSVSYWDGAAWVDMPSAGYVLDQVSRVSHVLRPVSGWPALGSRPGARVMVIYVAGFGPDGASVPEAIRQWLVVRAGNAVDDPTGIGRPPNEFINRRLDAWRTRI